MTGGTLPVATEMDFDRFIESRRTLHDKFMLPVDARARVGLLPGMTITNGALNTAAIGKSTPEARPANTLCDA